MNLILDLTENVGIRFWF